MTTPIVPNLGGIDMNKPIQYPAVFIAKPDRTIVGKLNETLNINLKQKLSNTNEYQFDVPYTVYRNSQWQKNPIVDMIRERYTMKLVYNNISEWYVIDEIQRTSADASSNSGEYVTVIAYSLQYELADKLVFGFDAEGINIETVFNGGTVTDSTGATVQWNGLLSNNLWTLGYVDSDFTDTYLTFKEDKITVLDCIFKVAQAFNAVIIWDTENRKINFYKAENVGVNRGLRLSYNTYLNSQKYLQNFEKDSKTDQLVTRLHVFGKNGISINSVNPTGSDYIEDYSFFMQGFAMDSNGNVTGHSPWMSDDLCKAITNYQNKVSSVNGQYQSLLTTLTNQQEQLTTDSNTLSNDQANLQSAQALVDTMNASTDNEITTMNFTTNGSKTATLNNNYYYAVMAKGTGADTVTIDGTAYTLTANTWTVLKKFNTATPATGTTSSTCQVTLANSSDSVNVIYLMIDESEYSGNESTQESLTVSSNMTVTTSQTPISGSISVVDNGTTVSTSDYSDNGTTITFTSGVSVGDQVQVSYQYANANVNQDIISKYCVDYNQTQVNNQQAVVNTDNQNISNTNSQIASLQSELAISNNFTTAEIQEWSKYIIEKTYEDTNWDDPQALYNEAQTQLKTMNQPQIVFTISLTNFMEDIKSQRDWSKFNLGDIVNVDFPYFDDNNIQAKMVEIDYDFEQGSINLTLANVIDIRTGQYKFIDMLYSASSTSASVNMNSYKWEKAYSTSNQVNNIINNTWDATKREITAGVNESVTINGRGITIVDPNQPNNMLIAQAGVLALSNDGGNTWKHAIRSDGIVGEQIYGKLIAGTNLTIDTDNGSFTVNENGVTIDGTKLTITNTSFLEAGTAYNGVTIDSTNGLVVTNSGNTIQTILNATDGIEIQTRASSTASWNTVFGVDTNGNLYANNLITTSLKVQTNDATPQTLIDAEAKVINFSGFTQINGTINGSTNIASGTVTGSTIASGTITYANIANATITGAKIASATITDANIYSVSANKITAGTITSMTLSSSTINGGTINGTTGNFGSYSGYNSSLNFWTNNGSISTFTATANYVNINSNQGGNQIQCDTSGWNTYHYGYSIYIEPQNSLYLEPGSWIYMSSNGYGAYLTNASEVVFRPSSNGTGTVGMSGIAWRAMYAGAFNTSSSITTKTNIVDASASESYDLIKNLGLKEYQYKHDIDFFGSDKAMYRRGILAEHSPSSILDYDGKSVDLYALISNLLGAVQYLQEKVETLEGMQRFHSKKLGITDPSVTTVKLGGSALSVSMSSTPVVKRKTTLKGHGIAKTAGGIMGQVSLPN